MKFFLTFFLLIAIGTQANADVPGGGRSVVPAQPNGGSATYTLGPEDQISIHVTDMEEISDKPMRIDPNGMIEIPLAGRLQAAGLTLDELSQLLAKKLSPYISSPQITINVIDYRSKSASVLGSVNSPGVQYLQGPKRLIDAISSAGGLKSDAGPRLTITREMTWGILPLPDAHIDASGNFSTADVLLQPLTSGQNAAANIQIRPDDVISVSKASVVYVLGEVKKAGGFSLEFGDGISLIRALSLAEGMTPQAAPKKARILRASEVKSAQPIEEQVDVAQVLAGKATDPVLHPNDILFVPNNLAGSAVKRAIEAAVQIGTGVVIFR